MYRCYSIVTVKRNSKHNFKDSRVSIDLPDPWPLPFVQLLQPHSFGKLLKVNTYSGDQNTELG